MEERQRRIMLCCDQPTRITVGASNHWAHACSVWLSTVTISHHNVLVLWGQGFDAITASIFVGELRRLGYKVKLVGLNNQQLTGQYGITLVPDLTLGQAMRSASATHCVIIPAPLAALQQFSYDPRLAELLRLLAAMDHAVLVVDGGQRNRPRDDRLFSVLPPVILEYPSHEFLFPFVQGTLAAALAIKPTPPLRNMTCVTNCEIAPSHGHFAPVAVQYPRP